MTDWAPPEAAATSWSPPEAEKSAAPSWTPPEASQDQPEQDKDGEFYKGLVRGSAHFNAAIEGIPNMLEAAVDKYSHTNLFNPNKIVDENAARQSKVQSVDKAFAPAIDSFKNIKGAGDLGNYAAGQIGEMAPNLALMIETGGIAGAATKASLTEAAALGGESALSEGTQAAIAKTALKSAALTSTLSSAAPASSQIYSEYLNKGIDAPGVAIGAGLLTSAIQTIVPMANIGKVLGAEVAGNGVAGALLNKMGLTNNLANKVLGGALTSATEMAVTNPAAEAVNILAEHEIGLNPNLWSKENANRMVEAMGSGMVGGAVLGAGLGPLGPKASSDKTTKEHVDDLTQKTEGRAATPEDVATAKAMQDKAALTQNDKAMLTQKRQFDDMHEEPNNRTERSTKDDSNLTSIASTPAEIKQMEKMGYKVEDRQRFNDDEWKYVLATHKAMDEGKPISAPPDGVDISVLSKMTIADQERLSNHLTQTLESLGTKKDMTEPKTAKKGDMVKWASDPTKMYKVVSSDKNGVMLENTGNDVLPEIHASHDEIELGQAALMQKINSQPGLQEWFGNSKVVDENGKPKVMYHGTSKDMDFKKFNIGQRGAWFTANPKEASDYAVDNDSMGYKHDHESPGWNMKKVNTKSRVIPAYLKIENPYHPDAEDLNKFKTADNYAKVQREIANKAKSLGHDGIIMPDGSHVVFKPEQIKSKWNNGFNPDEAHFKPSGHGDAYQDHVVPYKLAMNLEALPIKSPEKWKGVMDNITRIIGEMTGNKNLNFWRAMREIGSHDPIGGAQVLHMIHVALNDGISWGQAHETAYHEVYHMMVRSGVVSPKERSLFDHRMLRDYMAKDKYLSKQNIGDFGLDDFHKVGPESREELEANAFGKMMVEQHLTGTNTVPGMFKSAFTRVMNIIKRVGYMLKGNQINSIHDLLGKAASGGFREGLKNFAADTEALHADHATFQEMQRNLAEARFAKITKEQVQYHQGKAHEEFMNALDNLASHPSNEAYKSAVDKASHVESTVSIENNRKNQAIYARFINTPAITSVTHPIAAMIQNHLLNKREKAAAYTSAFHEALQPILKTAKKEDLYRMSDTMAKAKELRLKGLVAQKGAKFADGTEVPLGSIAFANQGKGAFIKAIDPITNPEHVRIYKGLQDAFAKQHDAAEKAYKVKAGQQFRDLLPDAQRLKDEFEERKQKGWSFRKGETAPDIYQLEHVQSALAKLRQENPDDPRIKKLQVLHDNLIDSDLMRRVDYIPFQRYGKFAFTVRSRLPQHIGEDGKAKQIALHTIEEGLGGNGMNQRQLERAVKDLKDKYGQDLKNYDVIGAKGKITNFNDKSQFMPYVLDHNNLAKNIDPRYMNVEMFSAMAHASKVDANVFRQVVQQIEDSIVGDTAARGFGRVFGRSENLSGYSRDWNRVLHTSTGGLAKMLSNLEHSQEHGALETAITRIEDGRLQKQMRAFWDYAGSPNEDMQAMRSINYLYAMGGNLSSAAVQISTLITRVWPEMTKYSPHMLDNLTTIAKNLSKAATYYTKAWKTGDTHAAREYMVKNKMWTQEQANVHRRAEMDNVLQSAMLQDAMRGGRPEDTTKFKHGLESVSKALALPVWKAEQLLRSATMMSVHELISKNPEAEKAAKRINATDSNIQTKMATRPDMGIAEHMGRYTLGLAHGEYGKEGRAAMYRGVGGIVMPFQNFVHNTLERLVHDAKGTPEEQRSMMHCVGALMLMGGLAGVPGVSFLEKMYDQLAKLYGDNQEVDTQRMIYEKLSHIFGDKAATALSYGLPRLGGISMSERLGIGTIPGQDQIFGAFSAAGQSPISAYSVAGSKLSEVQRARRHYQAGFGPNTLVGAMMPSGIDNLSKAYDLYKNGAMTSGLPPKQITGLRPQDVTTPDVIMRALGVESSHIADLKEKYYNAERLHGNKEYQQMFNEYESKMIYHNTQEQRAIQNKDWETAKREHDANLKLEQELYAKANKLQARLPPGFMTRINKGTQERVYNYYPQAKEKDPND